MGLIISIIILGIILSYLVYKKYQWMKNGINDWIGGTVVPENPLVNYVALGLGALFALTDIFIGLSPDVRHILLIVACCIMLGTLVFCTIKGESYLIGFLRGFYIIVTSIILFLFAAYASTIFLILLGFLLILKIYSMVVLDSSNTTIEYQGEKRKLKENWDGSYTDNKGDKWDKESNSDVFVKRD